MSDKVNNEIEALVLGFSEYEDAYVFSQGLCGTFALAMKTLYPDVNFYGAGPESNPSLHFMVERNGKFFDSTGSFENRKDAYLSCEFGENEYEQYGKEDKMGLYPIDKPYGESICLDTQKKLEDHLRELLGYRKIESVLEQSSEVEKSIKAGL